LVVVAVVVVVVVVVVEGIRSQTHDMQTTYATDAATTMPVPNEKMYRMK